MDYAQYLYGQVGGNTQADGGTSMENIYRQLAAAINANNNGGGASSGYVGTDGTALTNAPAGYVGEAGGEGSIASQTPSAPMTPWGDQDITSWSPFISGKRYSFTPRSIVGIEDDPVSPFNYASRLSPFGATDVKFNGKPMAQTNK